MRHFVLVAGNISARETSLTKPLGNNPYLSEFYADVRTSTCHLVTQWI